MALSLKLRMQAKALVLLVLSVLHVEFGLINVAFFLSPVTNKLSRIKR